MTHVASDLARFPERPPLEALFKGGVRVDESLYVALTDICAGGYYGHLPWFSAAVGPKGTYRPEHVFQYLRRHLEPMSLGRQWRILWCEVFYAILDAEVRMRAKEHG